MKKFYGILFLLALMAFKTNLQAQTCAGVSAGMFSTDPNNIYYGVTVTLDGAYGQPVTVSGDIISGDPDIPPVGFELTVSPGNLTQSTIPSYYQTTPGAYASAVINSVTPCPPSSVDLSFLRPTSSEVVTTGNDLYTNFVNATGIFQIYPSLTVTSSDLELVTLADTSKKIIFAPISGHGTANNLCAVYNSQNSDYMYFFMESSTANDTSWRRVWDETNTYLYSTIQFDQTLDIILNSQVPSALNEQNAKQNEPTLFFNASYTVQPAVKSQAPFSCFSGCINAQEERFQQTFSGWVIWNITKSGALVAAIYCKGRCSNWW